MGRFLECDFAETLETGSVSVFRLGKILFIQASSVFATFGVPAVGNSVSRPGYHRKKRAKKKYMCMYM